MADSRNPWLTWALPLVVVGVFVLSNWSWREKPPSTLAGSTPWRTTALLSAGSPVHTPAWKLVVDLPDDLKPPGPEWMLHEGSQPGQGYELHWLPSRLSLQVWRVGERLMLLGSATLDRAPRQVVFTRRGLRLRVEVDGTVRVSCLDLQPAAEPDTWGATAAADVGGARFSLYDERRFLPAIEREVTSDDLATLQRLADDPELTAGSLHAIARVRVALAVGARPGPQADDARRDARVALRALPDNHPDRPALLAWLSWESVRSAILHGEASALITDAEALIRHGATSELPGLLIDLIERLSERVAARPTRPVPPAEIFVTRRAWLTAISGLGAIAAEIDTGEPGSRFAPSENLTWHLRLVVHAADCLIGRMSRPTPAEGPTWVADRWRAFAGVPVKARTFADEPSGWRERNPLALVVQQLVSVAGFDPLPAVGLRAVIEESLSRGDPAAALARLSEAPVEIARHIALTRAILATRGIGSVEGARAALAHPSAGERSLISEDPLAFALDQLLQLGLRRRAEGSSGVLPGVPRLPDSLSWAGIILSGQLNAPAEVWRVLPERPLEGLAAALIMQEIAGATPDWSLLDQVPAFTVPLRLVKPVMAVPSVTLPQPSETLPSAPVVP